MQSMGNSKALFACFLVGFALLYLLTYQPSTKFPTVLPVDKQGPFDAVDGPVKTRTSTEDLFHQPPPLTRIVPRVPSLESKDPIGRFAQMEHDRKSFTLWTEPDVSFTVTDVLTKEDGWVQVKDYHKANLLWGLDFDSIPWEDFDGDNQWANRLYNESAISTKGSLAANVAAYQKKANTKIQVPQSHFLFTPEQCEVFMDVLRSKPSSSLWIIKHTHLSRGRGASVHTGEELLNDKTTLDCDNLGSNLRPGRSPEGRIVQEYISDPLLLDGYKSELRWYWLAIMDPFMLLLYPNATVRRTSEKYSLDDLKNIQSHLANKDIQRQANGDLDVSALKWTLPMLEKDLVNRGLTTPGWVHRELYPRVIRYLYDAMMAARPYIKQAPGTFSLFGADILLDSKLNMYLLEVQKNPGLSREGIKTWIIPPLLRQAANLLMELGYRKRTGTSLCTRDLEETGLFLMIYNEADASC